MERKCDTSNEVKRPKMKIEHVAIWVSDIEQMRRFYEKNFTSYFLRLAHFAVFIRSKAKVDIVTHQLREDGFKIIGEARTIGDGYYESEILDSEGNQIEITI